MIDLKTIEEGVLVPVIGQPGSNRQGLQGIHDGCLKVAVHVAPEKGKANAALEAELAKILGVRRRQVQLIQGETQSRKVFLVIDITENEIRSRLEPDS